MTKSNYLSCHIIGMNPYVKKIFNIVDLDSLNQKILKNPNLDKLYKQYQKLKMVLMKLVKVY